MLTLSQARNMLACNLVHTIKTHNSIYDRVGNAKIQRRGGLTTYNITSLHGTTKTWEAE